MPRGPAPAWTKAAPHTEEARPYVHAAYLQGLETEVHWTGIATKERAMMLRRGLFNASRLHRPQVSVSAAIEKDGSGWKIRFTLHDKRVAKAYIVNKHGSDRSQWPYNPRGRAS